MNREDFWQRSGDLVAYIIFTIAVIIAMLYITWGTNDSIARLNKRIDHLYTEQGQREMKCRAKGGEMKYDLSHKGWYSHDWEKFSCYSTKSEQVKIEI